MGTSKGNYGRNMYSDPAWKKAISEAKTLKEIAITKCCPKCGNDFIVIRKVKNDGTHSITKKEKKFCSIKCANSRIHNEETKNKISKSMKERLNNDPDLLLLYIKNWTSKNGKMYHSKGELKLKNWLIKNYPDFDWGCKHIVWNGEGFEFDIYSKKYDDYYIEYNGIIHYKDLYKDQKFEQIQRKDKLKIKPTNELNKKFKIIKDEWSWDRQEKEIIKFISNKI